MKESSGRFLWKHVRDELLDSRLFVPVGRSFGNKMMVKTEIGQASLADVGGSTLRGS
jgi:hypothetical protein